VRRRRFVATAALVVAAPFACASSDVGGLRERAAREGSVRVIVTLAVAADGTASEETIRDAQERVLAALRGTRYENVRRYRSLPQLALAVGPDALEVLLASPLVKAVAPDALARPMEGR
jgi:hypothetical protein